MSASTSLSPAAATAGGRRPSRTLGSRDCRGRIASRHGHRARSLCRRRRAHAPRLHRAEAPFGCVPRRNGGSGHHTHATISRRRLLYIKSCCALFLRIRKLWNVSPQPNPRTRSRIFFQNRFRQGHLWLLSNLKALFACISLIFYVFVPYYTFPMRLFGFK